MAWSSLVSGRYQTSSLWQMWSPSLSARVARNGSLETRPYHRGHGRTIDANSKPPSETKAAFLLFGMSQRRIAIIARLPDRGSGRHRKAQAVELVGQPGQRFFQRHRILVRFRDHILNRSQTAGGQVSGEELLHVPQVGHIGPEILSAAPHPCPL